MSKPGTKSQHASKEAKKGRKFTKKMMKTAHQWEAEDLELAGLNRILSVTQGAGGGMMTPIAQGASSAQEVAGIGTGLSGAANASKEFAILKSTARKADSDAKAAKEFEETAKSKKNQQYADTEAAASHATTADELAKQSLLETGFKRQQIPARDANFKFDKSEAGEWARYLNRLIRSGTGRDASAAPR